MIGPANPPAQLRSINFQTRRTLLIHLAAPHLPRWLAACIINVPHEAAARGSHNLGKPTMHLLVKRRWSYDPVFMVYRLQGADYAQAYTAFLFNGHVCFEVLSQFLISAGERTVCLRLSHTRPGSTRQLMGLFRPTVERISCILRYQMRAFSGPKRRYVTALSSLRTQLPCPAVNG